MKKNPNEEMQKHLDISLVMFITSIVMYVLSSTYVPFHACEMKVGTIQADQLNFFYLMPAWWYAMGIGVLSWGALKKRQDLWPVSRALLQASLVLAIGYKLACLYFPAHTFLVCR